MKKVFTVESSILPERLQESALWTLVLGVPCSSGLEVEVGGPLPRPWRIHARGERQALGIEWTLIEGDISSFSAVIAVDAGMLRATVEWMWPIAVPGPLQREFEQAIERRFERLVVAAER